MKRIILGLSLLLMLVQNGFSSEFCSQENINQNIAGQWENSNSYYYIFKIKNNKLCISVKDDYSNTKRDVNKIEIKNGKLKLFSIHTPSTNALVVYKDINLVKENKLSYNWSSPYGSGYNVLIKTK